MEVGGAIGALDPPNAVKTALHGYIVVHKFILNQFAL
jgi:hypothetical protein